MKKCEILDKIMSDMYGAYKMKLTHLNKSCTVYRNQPYIVFFFVFLFMRPLYSVLSKLSQAFSV